MRAPRELPRQGERIPGVCAYVFRLPARLRLWLFIVSERCSEYCPRRLPLSGSFQTSHGVGASGIAPPDHNDGYFLTYFVTPLSCASAVYILPAASTAMPSPMAPSTEPGVAWAGINIVTFPSFRLPMRIPLFQPG